MPRHFQSIFGVFFAEPLCASKKTEGNFNLLLEYRLLNAYKLLVKALGLMFNRYYYSLTQQASSDPEVGQTINSHG
jgi:hypothetical protein